jgi:hypothetical protein
MALTERAIIFNVNSLHPALFGSFSPAAAVPQIPVIKHSEKKVVVFTAFTYY